MSPELILGCVGVVMLVAALVWRMRAGRQTVDRVRLALLDADPNVRQAAIKLAAERGLSRYADLLLERTRQETSTSPVLATLAATVAQRQWEPADSPEMLDLRLWAHTQLNDDGSGTRISVKTPEILVPERTETEETAAPVERPLKARTRRATPRPAAVRRGGLVVAVTGAGGAAGIAVVRALMAAGHRVVAADADSMGAGLRLASAGFVLPRCDDGAFVDSVLDFVTEAGAGALMSTVAEELPLLGGIAHDLDDEGVATWLPTPAAVAACCDKWRFAQLMVGQGVRAPATNLGTADGVPGSWVVKPRFGRGSRDVRYVDRADDLAWALARVPEPIVQSRVRGREFTVDALIDRDGVLAGAVPRWRLETKAGISTKGATFEDEYLVKEMVDVLAAVGLTGPANIQGFVDTDGAPWFVEVNPRFSGGLPLSLAAGADLVGEYLRGVLGEPVRPERLTFRPGVTMIRHFEEIFE